MLEWLEEWKRGDKVTHGPPGLWDISKLNVPGVDYFEESENTCSSENVEGVKALISTEDFDPNLVNCAPLQVSSLEFQSPESKPRYKLRN